VSRRDGDAPNAEEEEDEEEDATRDAIELEKVARNGDPMADAPDPPTARCCAPLAPPAGTEECEADTVETVGDGTDEPLCDAAAFAVALVGCALCGEGGKGEV
jgi:hypothetical protein